MKLVIEIDEVRFKDIQRIASVQLENYHFKTAEQIIASGAPLPKSATSVEPEKKPGKWIKAIDPDVNAWTGGHICSECGRACVQMSMNYCANCGADMMEVQDDNISN